MGLESVTHIDDLVVTNPTATDGLSQGDDHIRNIKTALKTDFPNVNAACTASPTEFNILDGATVTTAELNILDGVTSTAAELNILDGVTSTAAELNLNDGISAGSIVTSKPVVYGAAGEVNATTQQIAGVSILPVVQVTETADATYSSAATALIPYDDTLPQITEGEELITVSITPKYNDSILYVDLTGFFSVGVSPDTMVVALFKDSDVDALSSTFGLSATATTLLPIDLSYNMVSGTTSLITFRIRVGSPGDSTAYMNGTSAGRTLGGSLITRLKVTEVKA